MSKASSSELVMAISALESRLARKFDQRLGLHGISYREFLVLHHLSNAPEGTLRRGELADKVSLSASGVTRMLRPMEKIGLVTKAVNPRDARVSPVTLSSSGRSVYGDALQTFEEGAASALKPLTHKKLIEHELFGMGIRLNKEPPKITFNRKEKGGIAYVPNNNGETTFLDEETVKSILAEYKIHHADVKLHEDATDEDLIDVIELHAAHAARAPPLHAHLVEPEADPLAPSRQEEQISLQRSDQRFAEPVVIRNANGEEPGRSRAYEVLQRSGLDESALGHKDYVQSSRSVRVVLPSTRRALGNVLPATAVRAASGSTAT